MNRPTRHRATRWYAAGAFGAIVAIAVALMPLNAGPAQAETPAQRCARETSQYDGAMRAAWQSANPGRPVPSPPPWPPYVCRAVPDTTYSPIPQQPTTSGPGGAPTNPNPSERPRVGADSPTNVEIPPRTSDRATPPRPSPDALRLPHSREPSTIEGEDYDYGENSLLTAFKNLNPNEKYACGRNLYDCGRAQKEKALAAEESVKYFPGPPGDTRQDAARHCIWQGLTTESSNADFARQIADAHEIGSPGGRGTPAGRMDDYNNATGRNVGLRHEGDRRGLIAECVTLARSARRVDEHAIPSPNGRDLVYFRD